MDFLFPDTLRSANPNEFGIVREVEVTGSRVVNETCNLHEISDFILSPSGCNADNDALGQDWYVIDEKAKYRLTSWREGECRYHTWVKLSDMPHGDVISVNGISAGDDGNVNVAELVCGTSLVSLPSGITEDDTFVLDKAEQKISGKKTFSTDVILEGFCASTSVDKAAVTKEYVSSVCSTLTQNIGEVCGCVCTLNDSLNAVIDSYVHRTGDCAEIITGQKTFSSNVILNGFLSDTTETNSAVTKGYVDGICSILTQCIGDVCCSVDTLNTMMFGVSSTLNVVCGCVCTVNDSLNAVICSYVHKTGNVTETIEGQKTFSSDVILEGFCSNKSGDKAAVTKGYVDGICTALCNSMDALSNRTGDLEKDVCSLKDGYGILTAGLSTVSTCVYDVGTCVYALQTDLEGLCGCVSSLCSYAEGVMGCVASVCSTLDGVISSYVHKTGNVTETIDGKKTFTDTFGVCVHVTDSQGKELSSCVHVGHDCIKFSTACFTVNPGSAVHLNRLNIANGTTPSDKCTKHISLGTDLPADGSDPTYNLAFTNWNKNEGGGDISFNTKGGNSTMAFNACGCVSFDVSSNVSFKVSGKTPLTITPTEVTVSPKLTGIITECISQDEDAINKCFFDTSIVSCSAGEKDIEYTTLPVDSSVAQDVSTELIGWNIFNKYKDVLNLKVVLESISFVTGTPLTDEGYDKEVYLSVEDWLPKEGMGFYLSKEAHTFESENKTIVFTFDEGTEFYSSVGEFNKRFLDDNELHVKFVTVEDDEKTEQKRAIRSRVLADGESSELVAYGGTYLMSPYATIKYKVYVDGKLTVKGNDVVLLNENQLVPSDKVFVSNDTCTQIGIEPSRNLFGVYSCTPDKNGNLIVNSTIIGDCGIEHVSICNDESSTTLYVNSNQFYTSSSSKYECESLQGLCAHRIESIYNGVSGFCVQNRVLSLCGDLIDSTSFFIGDGESRFVIDQGDGDTYSYLSEYRTKNEAGLVVDVDDGFFKEYYCESKSQYGKSEYNSQEFVLEECEDCSDKNTILRFTSCHSTTLTGVENWFKEYCSSCISTALPYSCSYGSFGSYGESTITEYWDTCNGDFYATSTNIDPWIFSFSSELYTTSCTDVYPERGRIKRGEVEGASLVSCSYLTIEPSGITIHPKLTGLVTKCITDDLDATNKEYVDTNVNNSINTIKDFIEERLGGGSLEKIGEGCTYYMSDLKDKINQIIDILKGTIQNG